MSDASVTGWPSHGYKARPWRTNLQARDSGGRRPPREDRLLTEIQVAVPPSISAFPVVVSPATTATIDEATASVVALDRGAGTTLSALSGFLLRSESIATSKIERIAADPDDLSRALVGLDAGAAARQTAAAVTAVNDLVDRTGVGAVTVDGLLQAHHALLRDDPLEGPDAGRFRRVQNWIGGSDFTPRGAVYIPPPPGRVTALVDDLLAFAARDDVPAIALAAIAHAQFESIHPFTDGNGRIGRALINATLRRRGLTTRIVVPVSSALLADVDGYFALLDAYRAGDADGFVRHLAEATIVASREAAVSADALARLPEEWRASVAARRGSATDRLLDRLLEAPVLTDRTGAALVGSSVRRIYDAFDRLTDAGILAETTGRSRNRVWVASEVLDELDRLEARIGRRARPTL